MRFGPSCASRKKTRPGSIIIITFLVGLGGFAHVIAGSVEVLQLVASGQAGWLAAVGWIIPTLLGNIIGGVSLVAALNHAQVVAGADSNAELSA